MPARSISASVQATLKQRVRELTNELRETKRLLVMIKKVPGLFGSHPTVRGSANVLRNRSRRKPSPAQLKALKKARSVRAAKLRAMAGR
jgi:hypothetical protein